MFFPKSLFSIADLLPRVSCGSYVTDAKRIHLPNMAAPAKFGYIVNWDTNDRKERRYQGIKHPIIALIECFHVTSQSSKFSRENSRRHVGVPSRLIKSIKSLGSTVIYIIKDV